MKELFNNKKDILHFILADFLFLIATSIFFAVPWALRNYPMQFHWNVFFVLASDTSGHDSGTGLSILKGFVIPTIVLFVIYKIIHFVFRKKVSSYLLLRVMGVWTFISFVLFVVQTKVWNYAVIAKKVLSKPVVSEFYEENFIPETDFTVIPPENKRNLIVIFMESMEAIFTDVEHGGAFKENLIPYLTSISNENNSFSDFYDGKKILKSGVNLQGTSWTVAGLLSKTTALPYFLPFEKEKDGTVTALKNATSLGKILSSQGYKNIFAMGSEKQFENRDSVLETHGFEVHDISYYKKNNLIPENYQVFWGFEDKKLYEVAKKELDELSKSKTPFCYGLLTVDTHFPNGFTCENCKKEFDEPIENVIRCADRQIEDFITWIQEKSWYENTTIVILGDHAYLDAPKNNFISRNACISKKEQKAKRGFFTLIVNPKPNKKDFSKSRNFSSFDVLPTVLEAIGNKIDGKGIYFGRSLYKEEETLVEKYSQSYIEKNIMQRTVQYESLK